MELECVRKRMSRAGAFTRGGFARAEYPGQRINKNICFLQHDMDLANQAGASYRGDNNNALQSLATLSSGATTPATTYAYQPWADTTAGLMKQRNAANTSWLVRGTLKETFVIAKSSGFTAGVSDFMQVFNCTSSFTIAFSAVATLGDGWGCQIRNNGTGYITLDPNGAETIDGATTILLGPGCAITVACNGSALVTFGRGGGRLTIFVPAAAMVAQTTSGATAATREMTTNKQVLRSMNFADSGADSFAQFQIALPFGWDLGALRFAVRWTGASGSGVVYYGLQAVAASDDDALDVAWGTAVLVSDTMLTNGDAHRTAESADVTVGGSPVANDIVTFRLYRDGDNASDTFSGTAEVLGVDLYYNAKTLDDAQ